MFSMRAKSDWRTAQPGVMLYMPAPRVTVESVCWSAQSQDSQVSDTIVPSCEDEVQLHIKHGPTAFDVSREDSPDTLVDAYDDEILLDAASDEILTPGSSASSDIWAQLMTAAESESATDVKTCPEPFRPQSIPRSTKTFLNINYDSDRTDYQEETPSPSLHNFDRRHTSASKKKSRHYQHKLKSDNNISAVRYLNFGGRVEKRSVKVKKSINAMSLENLRDVEFAPSHIWNEDERELLCVLNRWYYVTDRAVELTVFADVFNSIIASDIKPIRVRNQFESYLRLHGGNAFPEFGRVFSVPFDDPEGRYAEIRALIESEAEALGHDLQHRQIDTDVPSGKAKFAKSPTTRRAYKSLVRRALQKAKESTSFSVAESARVITRSIATTSTAVNMPIEDDWETLTDAEVSPRPSTPNKISVSTKPRLTFRVWDAENRTKFVDSSFVAQAFVDWPRPFPAPVAIDDPSEAGKILTVLHLSKHGDTPVYISTASSLLQALSYATNMQRPQIALIDLGASSLQEKNKVYHAGEVFPWLKAQGLARWARYKGNGEYFVWSDIPRGAVIHTMELKGLINSLQEDPDCRYLLNFDVFKPGAKTTAIAAALRERNVTLNTPVARALGKAAKAFGLAQKDATLGHLHDFVARLCDGWTIEKPERLDVHTLSSLAATFGTAMGSHAAGHTIQDVMGAFLNGVDHGSTCLAHWSQSRSGSRRQRFRTM